MIYIPFLYDKYDGNPRKNNTKLIPWTIECLIWLIIWLVVEPPTHLKNMTSSVGMIIPNIWKVIQFMFQTTNQPKKSYDQLYEKWDKIGIY